MTQLQVDFCPDVVVLGGGPAGLTCAKLCANAGLSVTLVDSIGFGGQLVNAPIGYSLPGQPDSMGPSLAGDLASEMIESGADSRLADIDGLRRVDGDRWRITIGGSVAQTEFVVAATGASPRRLSIDGSDKYTGHGICYCAPCDGPMHVGRSVAILADDRWALAEALCLADVVGELFVVARDWDRDDWEPWRDQILARPNAHVIDGNVMSVSGMDTLDQVLVRSVEGDRCVPVSALFVAIGSEPCTALFSGVTPLDESGAIVVGDDLMSSIGIYAVGDVRTGSLHTADQAIEDGTLVAADIINRVGR